MHIWLRHPHLQRCSVHRTYTVRPSSTMLVNQNGRTVQYNIYMLATLRNREALAQNPQVRATVCPLRSLQTSLVCSRGGSWKGSSNLTPPHHYGHPPLTTALPNDPVGQLDEYVTGLQLIDAEPLVRPLDQQSSICKDERLQRVLWL